MVVLRWTDRAGWFTLVTFCARRCYRYPPLPPLYRAPPFAAGSAVVCRALPFALPATPRCACRAAFRAHAHAPLPLPVRALPACRTIAFISWFA
jgi:hypothetical protein